MNVCNTILCACPLVLKAVPGQGIELIRVFFIDLSGLIDRGILIKLVIRITHRIVHKNEQNMCMIL